MDCGRGLYRLQPVIATAAVVGSPPVLSQVIPALTYSYPALAGGGPGSKRLLVGPLGDEGGELSVPPDRHDCGAEGEGVVPPQARKHGR